MNIYIHLLLFLVILFLYVHLVQQYKRSEDLEVYEMDYTNNENLQEVCDIKQPVLFEYKPQNVDFFEEVTVEKLESVNQSIDIKIKENEDYWKELDSVDYVVLPLSSSQALMTTDTHAKYFSENNDTFIEEARWSDEFRSNDAFLKPHLTAQTKYDVLMGSKDTSTPLRYHTYHRHFICVNSGKIRVKMTPWKSSKYLYPTKDYDNYEFFSPINVWKPQRKYFHEMDKIRFLEFDVLAGHVVFIPGYWWYSIQYTEEPTLVTTFTYNNAMNCLANVPNWFLYYLQQSSTKTKVVKTLQTNIVLETEGKDEKVAEVADEKEIVVEPQQ
jgi:hypothetical protein